MSAEQQEALEHSVRIARSCRGVNRAVELFLALPVTVADLVELWADPTGAWAARLDGLPWDAAKEARASFTRLKALVGEDGSLRDHGWGNGTDQISVATIGEEVAWMEAMLAPLVKLRKALATTRRAAA